MNIQYIEEFLSRVSSFKVLIIGETIIDEFQRVVYEGQSMKSFCPVFRLEDDENIEVQEGGALAIYNHLKSFVKEIDLISNDKGTIVKRRLVDAYSFKKHVEINKFNIDTKHTYNVNVSEYDLVILADFGHGFCDGLQIDGGFHLMCQTNSNNFGFNRMSKWRDLKKKSVCLDLREASLQLNKRLNDCTEETARRLYNYELNAEHMFVTLGGKGAVFLDNTRFLPIPVFKTKIVDTIGAGDAFFSFSSLVSELGFPEKYAMIPALAASLSTTWLCNEKSVTPNSLLEYANSII